MRGWIYVGILGIVIMMFVSKTYTHQIGLMYLISCALWGIGEELYYIKRLMQERDKNDNRQTNENRPS